MEEKSTNHTSKKSQKRKSNSKGRSSILLFIVGFIVIMAIFYAFFNTDFFRENILAHVANVNASISSWILNLFGQGTTASGSSVSSSIFSIKVETGCDGIEPIALFATAVLVFPVAFNYKWPGVLVGSAFLAIMNLLRVISLFLVGVYIPSFFDFMHVEVWQVIFIILAIVTWLVWVQWVMRKQAALRTVKAK
ncbi:MAG: archaeosortase/exosortase family protein [Chitinophagales bacterium]